MLPRDVMEVFELGRKQWRECKPPVEVGPGDSRFLPALAASKSGSCNDKQRGGVCFHGKSRLHWRRILGGLVCTPSYVTYSS